MADTNSELEAFLQESTSAAVSVPPEPERSTSTGESPPPSPASAPVQDDDDGDDASPASLEEGVQATVPREALEAERRRRQDHKERAARAEGENAALRRQLEALQRAPVQQQPQPQPVYRAPPPDPQTDPQGYAQYVHDEKVREKINDNLNFSEWMLRDRLGDEVVNGLQQEFKAMAEADQTLFQRMYSQPHPYRWMQQQVEKHRAMAEIGDDPAQFRAKIEAEVRAKWEAEQGQGEAAAPVPSRVAGMAPSLANARSSAPRSAPAYTGSSLEQMFPPYHERRKKA